MRNWSTTKTLSMLNILMSNGMNEKDYEIKYRNIVLLEGDYEKLDEEHAQFG
jgi:hypothetical protein